jgi:hypothetical protein
MMLQLGMVEMGDRPSIFGHKLDKTSDFWTGLKKVDHQQFPRDFGTILVGI